MSTAWYPDGWVLDVPNPGYGELFVVASLTLADWHVELTGADLGAFLVAVTARALDRPVPDVPRHPDWGSWSATALPSFITPYVAGRILPALQAAVILAAAGTDRAERMFYEEAEGPHEPLCVRCDEGTYFTPGALPSEWCDQYGHAAFGVGADRKWASAQERYTEARERWEARRRP